MTETALPDPFKDFERFSQKWDLPGVNQRYAARLASSIEELNDFHDALLPRMPQIKAYLDAKPMEQFTPEERRLGRLTFAWVIAAEAVEVFHQPRVPDSKMYWDVQFEPEL